MEIMDVYEQKTGFAYHDISFPSTFEQSIACISDSPNNIMMQISTAQGVIKMRAFPEPELRLGPLVVINRFLKRDTAVISLYRDSLYRDSYIMPTFGI
jgi:hypothetical protein